ATFGYELLALVTVSPGVSDCSVPDAPVAATLPALRTVSLTARLSPGSATPSASPPGAVSATPVAEWTSAGSPSAWTAKLRDLQCWLILPFASAGGGGPITGLEPHTTCGSFGSGVAVE